VIRYIRSPKHRPDDRLRVVLRFRPPQDQDQPYAQLDALYSLVLKGVENPDQLEKICLVFGILYFHSRKVGLFGLTNFSHQSEIEGFLELKAGDLFLLINPVLSLITINKHSSVEIFHKSLFDYLLDPSRGGHLPFDLARVHEVAATHIVKKCLRPSVLSYFCLRFTCYSDSSFLVTVTHHSLAFVHHCHFGYLNNTLTKDLHSLEVPDDDPLSWSIMSISRFMFDFFRILSRKV